MPKARFVTKWRYEMPGTCPIVTFNRLDHKYRAYEKNCGIRIALLANELPDGGMIRGSYETDNPAHIEILLKVRGPLKLENPQAVVDLGVKTSEEMASLGWPGLRPADVKPPERVEPKKAEPDLATMSRDALMKMANDEGIKLDGRLNKDQMLKAYEQAKKRLDK